MKRISRVKFLLCMAGIAVVIVAAIIIAHSVGQKRSSCKAANLSMEEQKIPEVFATEKERTPKGSIMLDGKKYSFFHTYETYLIIGTDASGNEKTDGENYQGNMADFLMLFIVDKTEHQYAVLQLNRDSITKVPLMQKDGTAYASADIQLCTAHWYGGSAEQSCENTVKAVSDMIGGIPISGYYELNMDKIPVLNHAVDGVEVTIQNDFTNVDESMKKGKTLTLSDQQAYTYIHDRYNVGDETNVSRMERQKQYFNAFFNKALSKSKKEKRFVAKLYKSLKDDAVTDISGKTISKLTKEIMRGSKDGYYTIEGRTKVGKSLGDGIEHVEFYMDKDSVCKTLTELYGLELF